MAGDDRQDDRGGGRGSEEEPEERTDGWMTTYADMVTLLMTFFVLMFAISNVDNQKAMLFFAGMSRDGLSSQQFDRIVDMFNPGNDPGDIWFPPPASGDNEDEPWDTDAGNPELDALFEIFERYIDDEGLGEEIQLVFNGEFLMLTLASDILFDTGSAVVRPAMAEVAEDLARILRDIHNDEKPFEIVVAGHTDNVPINTVRFPSNWHVSVARAVNFLEILIDESGLAARYFYARGCGEERPIATNDTAEGRQRNRRVEVMVSLARDDPSWESPSQN